MVITVLLSYINGFAQVNSANETTQNTPQFTAVFNNYFSIKDAFVSSDASMAATKATSMVIAIKAVDIGKLSSEEHNAWMKVTNDLTISAGAISKSKNVSQQRQAFALLSKRMYELAKGSNQAVPVFYQHCPMFDKGKGANWLSKESATKNPYYGNTMLTCGSVTETINNSK
ncbi:uncharacterized protein DUF3347 [Albibacterium bauzanense]|uniref:Uncharacterized protein DUF3347 n=2 Tax=Albibacterium bauzanense TaxID=653929 RepID=A0A4R1LUI5_9SPHI|nr:uncharacterized protein DUF3347 [Albibacterium bauzanense]